MKFLCLAIMFLAFTSCGSDKKYEAHQDPAPTKPEPSQAWLDIKPVVAAQCGKCHDGVKQKPAFDSAAAFKGSNALKRIEGGTMPPGGKIDPEAKAKLVAYLKA